MGKVTFETVLNDGSGFRADAVFGNTIVEVIRKLRDTRGFRSALLEMAKVASGAPDRRVVLILVEPDMTVDRIEAEWSGLTQVLSHSIAERLSLVVNKADAVERVFGEPNNDITHVLHTLIVPSKPGRNRFKRSSSTAFFEILRVLLIQGFRRTGPLTSKEIGEQTGFSYPTIANALQKLEHHLIRHSDRRVELKAFPKDAWFKLLAQVETVRSSQGFSDRSGRPRPIEVLLDRLRELDRLDIAVSGIVGARHYLPGIDLIGTPRLDLMVHAQLEFDAQDIVRELDAALKPSEKGEASRLVVHRLVRPASFFHIPEQGYRIADEVECLLDLHEARLESQAAEFQTRLFKKP
jgi:hypothetical protein